MLSLNHMFQASGLLALSILITACGAAPEDMQESDDLDSTQVAIQGACNNEADNDDSAACSKQELTMEIMRGHRHFCARTQPKDPLIADLVVHSWVVKYPLTRLYINAKGHVTGRDLPELLVGDLQVINSIPEARRSVASAIAKISGLRDYGTASIDYVGEACSSVPVFTPSGVRTTSTSNYYVSTGGVHERSWWRTRRAFAQECPLLKGAGPNMIDPPGDGSTNDPISASVAASGVRANAFGNCAAGTREGTYCKLSYATGQNWTGRKCQNWYGKLRCAVY